MNGESSRGRPHSPISAKRSELDGIFSGEYANVPYEGHQPPRLNFPDRFSYAYGPVPVLPSIQQSRARPAREYNADPLAYYSRSINSLRSAPQTYAGPEEHRSSSEDVNSDGHPRSGRAGVKRRQKYSRAKTGCLTCRTRRIKCDEGRPVCRRCVIAKKTCKWPEGDQGEPRDTREKRKRSASASSAASGSTGGDRQAKARQIVSRTHSGDGTTHFHQRQDELSVNAGDHNFDASFVGAYNNDATLPIGTLLPSASPTTDLIGAALEVERHGADGSAPLLSSPNFLLPWFPSPEERSLILHYCANAATLMMAIPSGINPMLAVNLPLALDSPRGANPAADALRVALLGIGAIHQAFLLARSGVATVQTASMFQYAANLRDTGKEMVRRAAMNPMSAQSDATLGAATSLATIDIFFGGTGWQDNFDLAKSMIRARGGPAAMLRQSQNTKVAEDVTVSPARLMLEILAIYETLACLTTGEAPSLLSNDIEPWWFDNSRSTWEEHSVEKQFGMSRVMVHLLSRLARLLSLVPKTSVLITEDASQIPLESARASTTNDSLLKSMLQPELSNSDSLVAEARLLNADIDAWIESLQIVSLEDERVQVGNKAYAYAMKILLLRRVFRVGRRDLRVQNAAVEVMKHCSTSTALLGMAIDLVWPAIIAACCIEAGSRQWVLTLFEGFKTQCCFDIETASRIVTEVWRRIDAGEDEADWKEVCDDLGLQVLLC